MRPVSSVSRIRQKRASDGRGFGFWLARVDSSRPIPSWWRILNLRPNFGYYAIGQTAKMAVKVAKVAKFCATPPFGDLGRAATRKWTKTLIPQKNPTRL